MVNKNKFNKTSNYKFLALFGGSVVGIAGIFLGVLLVHQPQLLSEKASTVKYNPKPEACAEGLYCSIFKLEKAKSCFRSDGFLLYCCPKGMTHDGKSCAYPPPKCKSGLNCDKTAVFGADKCLSEGALRYCCPKSQEIRVKNEYGDKECYKPVPTPRPCAAGASCGQREVKGSVRCSQNSDILPVIYCCRNGLIYSTEGCR